MTITKGMENREPASKRFDIVTPLWAQRAAHYPILASEARNGHTKGLIDIQSLARQVFAEVIAL